MEPKPFDSVENQIGFSGIWCGSCPAGNGSVIELTKRYEETVKKNQLEKWAPKDFDFKENTSQKELIARWKTELKGKFPHCLVLCNPQ